jgi:hypothetical protein
MTPFEMAARFAAFAWYTNHRHAPRETSEAEARRFSQENWPVFLPAAQEGWGRLLLQIARVRPTGKRRSPPGNRSTKRQLATAV